MWNFSKCREIFNFPTIVIHGKLKFLHMTIFLHEYKSWYSTYQVWMGTLFNWSRAQKGNQFFTLKSKKDSQYICWGRNESIYYNFCSKFCCHLEEKRDDRGANFSYLGPSLAFLVSCAEALSLVWQQLSAADLHRQWPSGELRDFRLFSLGLGSGRPSRGWRCSWH